VRQQLPRAPLTIIAVCIALLFVTGCAAPPRATDDAAEAPEEAYREPAPAMPDEERERAARDEEAGETATSVDDQKIAHAAEQKQIKNGEIHIEVPSPEDTMSEIVERVEAMDGFVSDSTLHQSRGDQRPRVDLTVRIPAEHFDAFTTELHRLGLVTHSRTWINDVTEEYIDLKARLENLRSEEEALRNILEKAENVEDMLAVRRQLNDVRGQIDSLSGRLRYLDDRIAYSTYRINLQPETIATTAIKATGFDNFGSRLTTSFIRGANWVINGLASATLAVATALPFVGVLAILLVILLAAYRRWGPSLF